MEINFNKANFWNSFRILFKTAIIGALILVMLIPTFFIQNLVSERKERQQEAIGEISSHWAAQQTVTGPVIGIPYIGISTDKGSRQETKRWAYFLPSKLDIHARLAPEKRYRGIYQAVVYTTEIDIRGSFDSLHLDELGLSPASMLWNEATVFFDISDLQGLKEDMTLHLTGNPNTADLTLSAARRTTEQFKTAFTTPLPSWFPAAADHSLEFSATLKLKGSGNLSFVPIGRETKVEASSSWPDPSFTGNTLPDIRTVRDSGFVAGWKTLALNRKFPQQWKEEVYDLDNTAFGVSLIVPVDVYQQTTRSVKYAILIILLTFTAFLLIEWVYNRSIHAIQYALVGFALCIFYTLLLSLSEYLGFNASYALAAIATIGLIAWYVGSLLHSSRMSLFITLLLIVQYGFVFTLIQLQDYALLMGSIGLFLTLAVVMYFSRKIKWEQNAAAEPATDPPAMP